jgi:hypothetical protein
MRFRPMLIAAGALSVLTASAASAWGGDPPGNNGTVKVGEYGFDDSRGNDPHVGCLLRVDFAGFDEGVLSGTATFELLPPTGRGVLLEDSTFIGEDPAGGANDLDASLTADLSGPIAAAGVGLHPQGFHVRLTVHADGSIGSDTKHKTFWVSDCGGEGGGD